MAPDFKDKSNKSLVNSVVLALCGFSQSLKLYLKIFPLTMSQSVDLGKQ